MLPGQALCFVGGVRTTLVASGPGAGYAGSTPLMSPAASLQTVSLLTIVPAPGQPAATVAAVARTQAAVCPGSSA